MMEGCLLVKYAVSCLGCRSNNLVREKDSARFAMTALTPLWAVIARIQMQPELVPLLDSAAPEVGLPPGCCGEWTMQCQLPTFVQC